MVEAVENVIPARNVTSSESAKPVRRNTWQREAVRSALHTQAGFVSAQNLHSNLRDTGSHIGLATVYRALGDLANEGEADSLQSPEGESLYRACSTGHHHHLICRGCGLAVEIEADAVELWAQRVARLHGFTQAEHVVDIFGYCSSCVEAVPGSPTGSVATETSLQRPPATGMLGS